MATPEENTTAVAPARCYLLELPAELKNNIYNLVLPQSTQSEVHTLHNAPGPLNHVHRIEFNMPPLLQVSRSIRAEALPIYMSTNTFRFVVPPDRRGLLSHYSSFHFNTTDSELKWVESFEFTYGDTTFAITAPGGLCSRKVEWKREDTLDITSRDIRGKTAKDTICDEYCSKVERVIDEAVAMRGSAARFSTREMKQIGAVLFTEFELERIYRVSPYR